LRCDEARRRLAANIHDAGASRHLETCAVCFAVLETSDPLAGALRAARPADAEAPEGLTTAILARWRPRRARVATALTAALAAAAVVVALAIEVLVGVEPARLGDLAGSVGVLLDGVAGVLGALLVVRAALFEAPAVLTVFAAVTVAACALWLRLALRPPAWRWVR